MKPSKIIATVQSKGKTIDGTPCKIKCFIHEDGVMIFQKYILMKDYKEDVLFFLKLGTKFNSTLYVQEFSFKYSTFCEFGNLTMKNLKDNIDKITELL
jgi:hypothetical protein